MKVVAAASMRDLDKQTIASGTPGEVLMERAGAGVWEHLREYAESLPTVHVRRLVVLAGSGNNGGDGLVVARLAAAAGTFDSVTVHAVRELASLQGDARLMADRLPETVTVHVAADPATAFAPGDLIVDALLGTGASGPLRAPYDAWVAAVNASDCPVVAVDLPTGLDADTGSVGSTAIRADLTICLALPKAGVIIGEGPATAGRLRVVDIGIAAAHVDAAPGILEVFSRDDCRRLLPRLPSQTHKGDRGKVLVLGCSFEFPGAGVLSGAGAMRMGAGLVTVAFPMSAAPYIHGWRHGLIARPVHDSLSGRHNPEGGTEIRALVEAADTVVIGPGLTRHEDALATVGAIVSMPRRLVVDADALSLLERNRIPRPVNSITVYTPHSGEFKRILVARGRQDLLKSSRAEQAQWLAATSRGYVVLKGPRTVVAAPDGRFCYSTTGTAGLATGGTGDILSGMIAAALNQIEDPYLAVCMAVHIHGLAAELSTVGMRSLIADDILDHIGPAMLDISPFA